MTATVDDLTLSVPASCRVLTDDGPTSVADPVAGTPWDFRTARRIGNLQLDTAYGDLERGDDGRAVVALSDPEAGTRIRLWVDEAFRYLMLYTADEVHDPERRRRAIAVEPMTCPPQAFRTRTDVIELAPGQSWRGAWGLVPELGG